MTNYEKIKNMSVEEMTEFLYINGCYDGCILPISCLDQDCKKCIKKYLESEVETE